MFLSFIQKFKKRQSANTFLLVSESCWVPTRNPITKEWQITGEKHQAQRWCGQLKTRKVWNQEWYAWDNLVNLTLINTITGEWKMLPYNWAIALLFKSRIGHNLRNNPPVEAFCFLKFVLPRQKKASFWQCFSMQIKFSSTRRRIPLLASHKCQKEHYLLQFPTLLKRLALYSCLKYLLRGWSLYLHLSESVNDCWS